MSILANFILNQYFVNFRCLIILTDNPNFFEYSGKQQIINLFINFSSNNTVFIDEFITTNYHGCQGIVVDTSKPTQVFEYLEDKIRHSLVRFHFRRYLIIMRNKKQYSKIEFETDALTYIADVLIVFAKNKNEFEMWTHNYVGVKDMNSLKMLDKWFTKNESFLFGNDLYPDKLTSQNGRNFVVSCIRYTPYALCDPELNDDQYYGTELKAAAEYAKAHNMTIVFKYNDNEEDLWGDLYSNWTGTGIMGNILLDYADIGFSALNTWAFVDPFLDTSVHYIRTGIPCLVPQPEAVTGWIIPLLSYAPTLWVAALINFFINIVAVTLINLYYEKIDGTKKKIFYNTFINSFWVVLKISLSQGLTKSTKRNHSSLRILFLVLLSMYSILDSSYFSGLASIMTIPRYQPPIDTVAELAHQNVKIYALSDAWAFSFADADDEVYLKILANFRSATVEQRELSKQKNNAFMIERLPFQAYAVNDYIQRDVIENYHLMDEDIFWDYTRFFLRKSSILIPSFDTYITRVVEFGIASQWQGEVGFYSIEIIA
ncbi:hypothetical protein WA026_018294 [Henosepilachna vigintioctopunctata]|uniref:Ionotropic glutamate receptor C-terminal domain-containing protein n=1 Tax=Henosepilachna vigintioctopunctata TaxID=420089 RepID=A0AAW1V8Q4_9CUCU